MSIKRYVNIRLEEVLKKYIIIIVTIIIKFISLSKYLATRY